MRLPRDVSAEDLINALRRYGYDRTCQTGSHVRLTTSVNGDHHVTIPRHPQLRVGTLQVIIKEIVNHLNMDWEALAEELLRK